MTDSRSDEPTTIITPPDRSFGLLFAFVFGVLGAWPLLSSGAPLLWSWGIAAVFAVLALVKADLLHPLNVLWMRFGLLLHTIMTPVLMAILFFGLFTPMGL
ncbi:MAG: hypothetical protein HQL50_12680, partial [Magnetococcales bacterium]|nr:hypothetical protein [Magnetococcales bacterium]